MWAVNMLPVRALPASGRFGGCGGAQPMLCRPDMAGRCAARRDPIPSPHAVQGENHPRGQVLVDPRTSAQGIGNSPAGRESLRGEVERHHAQRAEYAVA